MDEYPKSVNLAKLVTEKYIITVASWEPYEDMNSYEIGIRSKADHTDFKLLQGDWGRSQSTTMIVGKMVRDLLSSGWELDVVLKIFGGFL